MSRPCRASRVTTPPGFSATLRGIPYCPEAAIARSLRAADTRARRAGRRRPVPPPARSEPRSPRSGAGSRPAPRLGQGLPRRPVQRGPAQPGRGHAGRHRAPTTSATSSVRVPLSVDPVTAQVTAVSDPIPQIIEGVPLRLRSLRDQPRSARIHPQPDELRPVPGPGPDQRRGRRHGQPDAPISRSPTAPTCPTGRTEAPAQRLDEAARPSRDPRHPHTKPGEANTRRVSVTLPKGGLLDNAHIETICTRVQFAADACPDGSLIGKAEAAASLLDAPLKGSVYLRASSNKLPDMVVDLEGPDRHPAGRADRQRQAAACGRPSRRSPTRR